MEYDMNEETIPNIHKRINDLEKDLKTPRKIVISPNIPISLFVAGPAAEDALYLPKGKISQVAITLLCAKDTKDAILLLNVVQPGSNVTEEISLRPGQVVLDKNIVLQDWTIIRAKITTEDLSSRLVIGFNFQPSSSYVAEKGVDLERISTKSG